MPLSCFQSVIQRELELLNSVHMLSLEGNLKIFLCRKFEFRDLNRKAKWRSKNQKVENKNGKVKIKNEITMWHPLAFRMKDISKDYTIPPTKTPSLSLSLSTFCSSLILATEV